MVEHKAERIGFFAPRFVVLRIAVIHKFFRRGYNLNGSRQNDKRAVLIRHVVISRNVFARFVRYFRRKPVFALARVR